MPTKSKERKGNNKGDDEELDEASSNRDEEILAAIQALRKDFTTQLQEVITSNQGIKEAINSFSERLDHAETRISSAEDQISDLDAKATSSQRDVLALTKTVEAMESRQRRLNLRLVGLPEGTERGRDLALFLAEWLPKVLGSENFQDPLFVDEAFRLPLSTRIAGRRTPPPRTILIKFRWLTDKDRVMTAAREKKPLQFEGNRLMFFPDLPPEVQQQRRKFGGVKADLHNLGIEFGMQYPAKMKIYLDGGETLTFLTPAEVQDYIKTVQKERSPPAESMD